MTLTDQWTDEKVKVAEPGDHDRFKHYFPNDQIDANLLAGVPMMALCGKVVEQQVDPAGRTICQTCRGIHDDFLLPGDDE